MTTFALIHGAYHGGWCWEAVGEELEARGHRFVAPDLPCDDPTAGVAQYAQVVVDALEGVDEEVSVVGHSMGGLTAAVVASMRPVREVVFLAAVVPEPARAPNAASYPTAMAEEFWARVARQHVENGLRSWEPDDAIAIFFHDCDPQVARWASGQLRPQSTAISERPSPLVSLPTVPYRYIACADDRALAFDWQLDVARRLGVEPVVIGGGHSPFLSHPRDLVDILVSGWAR